MIDAGDDHFSLEAFDQAEVGQPYTVDRVLSVAYPTDPSPKSTSSTHSGRRVVIERAIAERFPSGAITASRIEDTLAKARRSACSPAASMPSSFVSSTCT